MKYRKDLYLCTVIHLICTILLIIAMVNESYEGLVYSSAFYGYSLIGAYLFIIMREIKSTEIAAVLQAASVICLAVATCMGDFQGEIFRYGYIGAYLVLFDLIGISYKELQK